MRSCFDKFLSKITTKFLEFDTCYDSIDLCFANDRLRVLQYLFRFFKILFRTTILIHNWKHRNILGPYYTFSTSINSFVAFCAFCIHSLMSGFPPLCRSILNRFLFEPSSLLKSFLFHPNHNHFASNLTSSFRVHAKSIYNAFNEQNSTKYGRSNR